jgi:hypothetical protein
VPPVRTSRLFVSAALSAGLVAGALAGSPATAVDGYAATPYTCDFGETLGVFQLPFEMDIYDLPRKMPVGIPVESDWSDAETVLGLPDALVEELYENADSVAGIANGLQLRLGDDEIPVDLLSDAEELSADDAEDDSVSLWLDGSTGEYVPAHTGTQTVSLPTGFVLQLVDEDGDGVASASCTLSDLDADVFLAMVEVVKQKATVKAAAVKKVVKEGKRPRVLVNVLNQLDQGASGGVVATVKGKTVGQRGLSDGKAKLRLAKLPVGTHSVTITYQGTDTVASATKTVVIKVVRR